MYDNSRENIAKFLGDSPLDLIVFGWGEKNFYEGEEIIIFI